jgi:RNA polymerase sigma factor (sigma-70 family)
VAAEPVNSVDTAAAFTEAVRGEMPRMLRLAARLAPGSADDVVQEALVRAWRHRSSFDPARGAFRTWLLTIVANEARRRTYRRRLPEQAASTNASHLERSLDVQAAVRHLSPRQRLAVDCFYFADLTVAETAAVMQCSEGTVKSTLSDARERLRRDLRLSEQ